MAGPWEAFAPQPAQAPTAGPWSDFAAPASMIAHSDTVSPGTIPRVTAGGMRTALHVPVNTGDDMLRSLITGAGQTLNSTLSNATPFNIADTVLTPLRQAATIADAAHNRRLPTSLMPNLPGANVSPSLNRATGMDYMPQTVWGERAQTLGQMAPAALAPGSIPAKVANVLAPAIGAQMGMEGTRALGGDANTQAAAKMVGGLFGGMMSAGRMNPSPAATTPDEIAAQVLASRAGADPVAMRQQAAAMAASGVRPTILDVAGQKGLRLARAVGVTNDDAGEALQNNAIATMSGTKPAVMAQTRTLASDTPQTASALSDQLSAARDAHAQADYRPLYDKMVQVPDAVKDMLADTAGRSIIGRARSAAIWNQDWGRQVELDKLLQPTEDGQLPQISAGTLDRLQIAARESGRQFAASNQADKARGAFGRQTQINGVLDAIPELAPARQTYRNTSQAIDVLNKPGAQLDPFSTDPSDYATWHANLSPEAQNANQVKLRQDILDTLGGQRAHTFGSVDELATSPYARANLTQAFGPQEAGHYLDNLAARLTQARNAQFVSPNGGSRTAVLANDMGKTMSNVVDAADMVHKAASGNYLGMAAKTAAWLKTRGLSDQQSQALASASVDPARLDAVISAIERAKGARAAQGFITFRHGLIGAMAPNAAPTP